ncbi:hypothetical protein [Williamsia sp. CHRR-6]|uniref:mycothiol-dependent nitroreductase Rv2466c family protein n=1 Tax=Williamsia sp. CHRR-6 TaxID=2835871 RepID=UPI001BD9E5B1|nr:hypothetical protein [Williamsia sp. CHRR-6]MBT0566024.1 hypothetical protein [Williamsia sp. CHRR-6]
MTHVDCHVDLACPFAWATTLWLRDVGTRRHLEVTLHQMSLAVLNEGRDLPAPMQSHMQTSLRGGRLLAASGDRFGDLYLALGRRLHEQGEALDDTMARAALIDCGLDPGLTAALDDPAFDDAVRAAHTRAQDTLGEAAGSPIIAIEGHPFFGPVLSAVPDPPEADAMFDAIAALGRSTSFSQLQRPRAGRPAFAGGS